MIPGFFYNVQSCVRSFSDWRRTQLARTSRSRQAVSYSIAETSSRLLIDFVVNEDSGSDLTNLSYISFLFLKNYLCSCDKYSNRRYK